MKMSIPLLPPVRALCDAVSAMLPTPNFQDPTGVYTLNQYTLNLTEDSLIRVYAHVVPCAATADGGDCAPALCVTLAVPPELRGTPFSLRVTRFLLDGRGEQLTAAAKGAASQMAGWGEAASTATVAFPLADLLAEESAILVVLTVDLETLTHIIADRHALIQEDARHAQDYLLQLAEQASQ
jgi:hypothetical protein